jgi:hypothetical protein
VHCLPWRGILCTHTVLSYSTPDRLSPCWSHLQPLDGVQCITFQLTAWGEHMVVADRYWCTNCTSIIVHLLVLASKQVIGSFYPQHSGSRTRLFAWLQATAAVHHKLAWACNLSLPQNWHVKKNAWSVATKIFLRETCQTLPTQRNWMSWCWPPATTTRNFIFCNLSYVTKKCCMQLHMLHATPK